MSDITDFGVFNNYYLPVITPPTTGDPTTFYQNLNINIIASQESNYGIKYNITRNNNDISFFDHYIMVDSLIHFVKSGYYFPLNTGILSETLCTKNTLILYPTPLTLNEMKEKLPVGIPVSTMILIENIDESSFIQDLSGFINASIQGDNSAFIDEYSPYSVFQMTKWIDDTWHSTNNTDPTLQLLSDKIALFISKITNGNHNFFLRGGSKLGKVLNNINNVAEFTIKMLDSSLLEYITPIPYLRSMISLPNTTVGMIWTNHPLITSISSFSIPLDIYLKFEIWNPLSFTNPLEPEYVPLDDNCEVSLMDYDKYSFDDAIIKKKPIINGKVVFHKNEFSSDYDPESDNDFYFKVINPSCTKINTYNQQNPNNQITLPSVWSTKANSGTDFWLSVDGTPGYIESFKGFRLGSQNEPIIYRVGFDYHLEMMYFLNDLFNSFPKGISCCVVNEDTYINNKVFFYNNEDGYRLWINSIKSKTDQYGKVHGISFDIEPNKDLMFIVYFEMNNPEIRLISSRIDISGALFSLNIYEWVSKDLDIDHNVLKENQKTSIGNYQKLYPIQLKEPSRVSGLYVSKILYEVAYFFNYFTKGTWKGFDNMEVNVNTSYSDQNTSSSIPLKQVFIDKGDVDNRETIVHEILHQIMYNELKSKIPGLDLVFQSIFTIKGYHTVRHVTNKNFAFYEGWTEGFGKIFSTIFSDSWDYLDALVFGDFTKESIYKVNNLTPLPINTGERVEGAFANILTIIFYDFILKGYTTKATIFESKNGNLSEKNDWMNDSNRNVLAGRFLNLIYNPLKSLKNDTANSTGFYDAIMRNIFGIDKLRLRANFYRWNSYIVNPEIISCNKTTLNVNSIEPLSITVKNIILPDNYSLIEYSIFKESRNNHNFGVDMKIIFEKGDDIYFSTNLSIISETEISISSPNLTVTGTYDVQILIRIRYGDSSGGFDLLSNTIQINVQK